jgi:hypothetical protein
MIYDNILCPHWQVKKINKKYLIIYKNYYYFQTNNYKALILNIINSH